MKIKRKIDILDDLIVGHKNKNSHSFNVLLYKTKFKLTGISFTLLVQI